MAEHVTYSREDSRQCRAGELDAFRIKEVAVLNFTLQQLSWYLGGGRQFS
jgi:hypothetical protein